MVLTCIQGTGRGGIYYEKIKSSYSDGRTTYVIDKQGRVAFLQEGIPVNEELLKQLKLLQ